MLVEVYDWESHELRARVWRPLSEALEFARLELLGGYLVWSCLMPERQEEADYRVAGRA